MKIRAIAVIIAFAICLGLLLIVRQALAGHRAIHQLDFYDNGADWNGFQFNNLVINGDRSQLIIGDGRARLTSPIVKTRFSFNEILLSWNCYADDSSGLAITLFVSKDSILWHDFAYLDWGHYPEAFHTGDGDSTGKRMADIGFVDTDIIKLNNPANYYKFVIDFSHGDSLPFYLDRIIVCYTNSLANSRQFARFGQIASKPRSINLAVPFIAQGSLPDSIAGLTCSPTCVAMVLNYFGHQYAALEVAATAHDSFNQTYGNWPYNVEAAYLLGLKKTWVGRHNSFGELAGELEQGKPVIISIEALPGKLTGAPYETAANNGHLIVVRGFDGQGRVLVNDPAGGDPQEGIIAYDIKELTDAWVGHGGVAYHLWPEP